MKGDTWFKFYVKAIWSPSLRKLTPTQRWVWNTLLALATEGDGVVHGAATEPSHIALASATDARGVPNALAKMQHLCLINVRKNGDIKIRNWLKYQSTTAERRKRKVRQIGGEKPADKRQVAAPDKKLEVDKNKIKNTPTKEEAIKYYSDKLGNIAVKLEGLMYDFGNSRKTKTLTPKLIIKITDGFLKFSPNILMEAREAWNENRYAKEGKRENYFLGICRRLTGESRFRKERGLP